MLLDRLESSAWFTEQSCSFSRRDLLDKVLHWLRKAAERLAASASYVPSAGALERGA